MSFYTLNYQEANSSQNIFFSQLISQFQLKLFQDQEALTHNISLPSIKSKRNQGRPKVQNINKKRAQLSKRWKFVNYNRALTKTAMYTYNKIATYGKKNQRVNELLQKLLEFVENPRLLCSIMKLMTQLRFPNINQTLMNEQSYMKYIEEVPLRSVSFGLRKLKQFNSKINKKDKIFTITQIELKCIQIAQIFVVGIDLEDLQQIQEKCKQSQLHKGLIKLLKKTKLLTNEILNYLIKNWESILELMINKQLVVNGNNCNQIIQQEKNSNCLSQYEEPNQKSQSEYEYENQNFIQRSNNLFFESTEKQSEQQQNNQNSLQLQSIDQIDQCIYSVLSLSGQSSYEVNQIINQKINKSFKNQNKPKLILKENQVKNSQNKNILTQPCKNQIIELLNCSHSQRRDCIYRISKKKQVFNYMKSSSRGANKINYNNSHLSQSSVKQNSKKFHKSRDIDLLIDLIANDQFFIAQMISNYLYHCLKAQEFNKIQVNGYSNGMRTFKIY